MYSNKLLALTKSANVKKYWFSEIRKEPILELMILENEWVSFTMDQRQTCLKGTVSLRITDNLAAHEMGGFV